MSKLEKLIDALLKIGKIAANIDVRNITLLSINYNSNNNSPKISADRSGKIDVNLTKLSPEEDEIVKELNTYMVHGAETKAIGIETEADKRLLDFKDSETPHAGGTAPPATYFEAILSKTDLIILRAAQYFEKKWRNRDDSATAIKKQITLRHGDRGRNICNMLTAGYFQTLLIPMHKQVIASGGTNDDFIRRYDKLVQEIPFAVFVNRGMGETDIQTEITQKALRNLKYGTRKLAVHGIGQDNARRIRSVLEQMKIPDHTIEIESDEYSNGVLRMELSFRRMPRA